MGIIYDSEFYKVNLLLLEYLSPKSPHIEEVNKGKTTLLLSEH